MCCSPSRGRFTPARRGRNLRGPAGVPHAVTPPRSLPATRPMLRPSRPARSARRTARRGGFTLIEVLLVLAILGVIAALVVPGLLGSQERANVQATEIAIKTFQSKVEEFAINNNGRPPQGSQEAAVKALMSPTSPDGRTVQPYLDETPKDAWGEPLFYRYPASNQTIASKPDIWSAGPDGRNDDGGGDDVNNWANVGR